MALIRHPIFWHRKKFGEKYTGKGGGEVRIVWFSLKITILVALLLREDIYHTTLEQTLVPWLIP